MKVDKEHLKRAALCSLFVGIVVAFGATNAHAQKCSVKLPEGLPDGAIPPIGTGVGYIIQHPDGDGKTLVSCKKTSARLVPPNTPQCNHWGSPIDQRNAELYLCDKLSPIDFCEAKRFGVEVQTGDASRERSRTSPLPSFTYGFCAPIASAEASVKKRPESPIVGYNEGQFMQFSCQPGAAEGSACTYTTSGRYPYLAHRPGASDLKNGKCRAIPDGPCTMVYGHGQRWADPTCRKSHGAKPPPAWNADDLGNYLGKVEFSSQATFGPNYYSHPGMGSAVKLCWPDEPSAGGGGSGSTGGGSGSTGGGSGSGSSGGTGGGTGAASGECPRSCTLECRNFKGFFKNSQTGECKEMSGCSSCQVLAGLCGSSCSCAWEQVTSCPSGGAGGGGNSGGGTGGSTGGSGSGGSTGGSGRTCGVDKCGDGICQAVVCMGCGCPIPETAASCAKDCGGAGSGGTGGSTGSGSGSNGSGGSTGGSTGGSGGGGTGAGTGSGSGTGGSGNPTGGGGSTGGNGGITGGSGNGIYIPPAGGGIGGGQKIGTGGGSINLGTGSTGSSSGGAASPGGSTGGGSGDPSRHFH